ncbi:MAG: NAD(P)-dependent oxidoreductase, partial [Candidatus Delongbacteria bacterium]|nr:NAD(P)-dependent oxidoreductase [Candidatus Delongbacteria bacterium]
GKKVNVTAISSNELNLKAKRPANSSLDNIKISKKFGLEIRSWDTALKEAIEIINAR